MDYLLWELSFQNLSMLLATIPSYESDDEKKKGDDGKVHDGIDTIAQFLNLE
jgi:hypothetical protein